MDIRLAMAWMDCRLQSEFCAAMVGGAENVNVNGSHLVAVKAFRDEFVPFRGGQNVRLRAEDSDLVSSVSEWVTALQRDDAEEGVWRKGVPFLVPTPSWSGQFENVLGGVAGAFGVVGGGVSAGFGALWTLVSSLFQFVFVIILFMFVLPMLRAR